MNYFDLPLEERKRRVRAEMRRLALSQGKTVCSLNMWQSRNRYFPSVGPLCRSFGVSRWAQVCELVGMPSNPGRPMRNPGRPMRNPGEWTPDETPSKVDILDIEKGPLALLASDRWAKPYRYWDTVSFCWRETVARPCGRFDRVLR